MKKKNELSVRLYGIPTGILLQDAHGKMTFAYDSEANQALSLAMPLAQKFYDTSSSEAFFGGLLPESQTARALIGKHYNISPYNNFALLKAIGYDCAGAISCHLPEEPINSRYFFSPSGLVLSEEELYQHIKNLSKDPLFMNVEGLRLSLAGVQDKAALCVIENQLILPQNGCPTTHLLKPQSPHFEGLCENEYFCLKVAKKIGLPVPNVELHQVKDISYLLIERYDRKVENGQVGRIHQEDFCQALGIVSTQKYQNEGGPGFKECFDLLRYSSQPAFDRNLLANAMVFNYLIGNMDAHAKNFSLLHFNSDHIRLAPFYDLICTTVYPAISKKMAMKIGGKYQYESVLPRHWEQLGENIGYRYIAIKELIEKQADLILKAAYEERDIMITMNHKHPIIDRLITAVENNINTTLKRFHL